MIYKASEEIKLLVNDAKRILIIQADNPDADSLGSALALEQIFMEEGKETALYCSVELPQYLRYLRGWDRVSSDIDAEFDISVIVDASTMTLLEKLQSNRLFAQVKIKPVIVLDHHATVENQIDFAQVIINDAKRSSAGELIYVLAKDNSWQINQEAIRFLAASILGDTQGLTNNLASSESYRVLAEMIDNGLDRPDLEEQRREYSKMPQIIYKYKAELINRTEFFCENKLALVSINQAEINKYSPLYNPAPLIQSDMLSTADVEVAVVIKIYNDGRITGAIRSNNNSPIAGKLAEQLGGGGHDYASGFKVTEAESYDSLKADLITKAAALLKV